jgi:general secretion pathway protein K
MRRRMLHSRRPGRQASQRGIALILVITSVAILTAVSVDLSYNSRVDLELATNARDELRAYWLARSSINLSRLILKFQKQLDSTPTGFDPSMLMGLLGGGAPSTPPGAAAPGAAAGAGTLPSAGGGGLPVRLWQMIPVDCSVLQMLLAGAGSSADAKSGSLAPGFGAGLPSGSAAPLLPGLPSLPAGLPNLPAGGGNAAAAKAAAVAKNALGEAVPLASFGDFDGCFHAEMEDEDQKINMNRLTDSWQNGAVAPVVTAYHLFSDPRFTFVFDHEDANRVKMTAFDTTLAIIDWIDYDDTQVAGQISPTGQVMFTNGFGDENRNYTRYPHPYRAKNNKFDSLDEMYMVDGVSDEFMAAFRDRLTVYADINDKININTDDPLQQQVNVMMADANQADPNLYNPLVMHTILNDINMTKAFLPFFGLSVQQYAAILQRNGITVSQFFLAAASDKSQTFTIHGSGTAGRVEKNITAVVNIRDSRGLGRLVYWHED